MAWGGGRAGSVVFPVLIVFFIFFSACSFSPPDSSEPAAANPEVVPTLSDPSRGELKAGPEGDERRSSRTHARQTLVLISLDTLRADQIDGAPSAMPHLDEAFRTGIRFEQAFAPSGNTLVSHASLLTGMRPREHRLAPGHPPTRPLETLATSLRAAGYATAGFAAHGDWLTPAYGFDRGFDHYEAAYRSAREQRLRALQWVEEHPNQSIFLFVHFFDAHSDTHALPYEAMPGGGQEAGGGGDSGRFSGCFPLADADGHARRVCASEALATMNQGRLAPPPGFALWAKALYRAGVGRLDAEVGALLDAIQALRGPDALVMVVADHGEAFQEHGVFLHEIEYEEVLHIPALLKGSNLEAGRISWPMTLRDVAPTLLGLSGVDVPETMTGRNVAGFLRRKGTPPPPVITSTQSVRYKGWKRLVDPRYPHPLLFDLRADPQEKHNKADEFPERIERLKELGDGL